MGSERDYCATVFVDADNTLWETDEVYALAQLQLLTEVESATGVRAVAPDRLALVRDVDQQIAERHHAGLRYPPRLLAQALALVLRGAAVRAAVRAARLGGDREGALNPDRLGMIERQFLAALKIRPALRNGVKAGLEALNRQGCLVLVVTEGARMRVEETIRGHGLTSLVDRVIEAPKQTQLYRRIARISRAPAPMFMVGDQLHRDIAPAHAAGLRTVYFPGRFRPRWEANEAAVKPDYVIASMEEVVPIVRATIANLGSPQSPFGDPAEP